MSEAWQPNGPEEEFNPETVLAKDVINKIEQIIWADSRSTTFALSKLSENSEIHEDPETAEVLLDAGIYHIQALHSFLTNRAAVTGEALDMQDASFGILYARDAVTGTTKAYTCTDIVGDTGTSYLVSAIVQEPEIRKSYIVMMSADGHLVSSSTTLMAADVYPSGIIGPASPEIMDAVAEVQAGRLSDEDLELILELLHEYARTVAESDDDADVFVDILRRRHASARMMREITGGTLQTALDSSELRELYHLLDEEI